MSLLLLRDIKTLLRAGEHPREFADMIGDGAQRGAWLCGYYVIKRRAAPYRIDRDVEFPYPSRLQPKRGEQWHTPKERLRRFGVLPPRQWFVRAPGNVMMRESPLTWVIQHYYRPLTADEQKQWQWINRCNFYMRLPATGRKVRLDIHTGNMGIHPVSGTIHAIDW